MMLRSAGTSSQSRGQSHRSAAERLSGFGGKRVWTEMHAANTAPYRRAMSVCKADRRQTRVCSVSAAFQSEKCDASHLPAMRQGRCRQQAKPMQASGGRRRSKASLTVAALPFAVPEFRSSKLSVEYTGPEPSKRSSLPDRRFYTLTHNDLTGDLFLTVGCSCNADQISGWYNRLVRDEILAEWEFMGEDKAVLHVHCHVSGEERWLAPPLLRDYIFRREMQLVLDCFVYAEQQLLACHGLMANARVMVHLESNVEELNCVEDWGILGDRSTWQPMPLGLVELLISQFVREGPSCSIENPPPSVAEAACINDTSLSTLEEEMTGFSSSFEECSASVMYGSEDEAELQPEAMVLNPTNLNNSPAVRKQRASSQVRSSTSRYSGIDFGASAPVPAPVVMSAGRRRDLRR